MENAIPADLRDRLAAGDPAALSEATALLYRELRAAARAEMRAERKNHTLQPTGLVHEALIRMRASSRLAVESSGHFLNLAREVMRHVLKDHARARGAAKRHHLRASVAWEELDLHAAPEPGTADWNKAIEKLERRDPVRARIIEMKYRLGHTWDEIAAIVGITVNQARFLEVKSIAWLRRAALQK